MKKITYLLLFVSSVFISSCNEENMNYSCDELTNKWVMANLDQIRTMDVKEWSNLDDTLKIPIYRAFTHKQRIEFWRLRFRDIKQMKWSKEELLHIEKAENFFNMHLDLFSENKLNDDQLNELELFGYTWMSEAIEKFGWTPQIGNLVIGTGYTIRSDESINDGNVILKRPEKPKKLACHCHGGNVIFHSCYADFTSCEKTDKCEDVSPSGCGLFLLEECDGLCL